MCLPMEAPRAFGVGACARLIPTLGGPGEASGPRTDGFHRLDSPRTPGASGARGREDPSWVAAMACLWGDVLSKTKLGDTGPRRPQDSHWRDHGLDTYTPRTQRLPVSTPSSRRIGLFGPRTNRTVLKLARGRFVVPARYDKKVAEVTLFTAYCSTRALFDKGARQGGHSSFSCARGVAAVSGAGGRHLQSIAVQQQ